MLDNAKTLEEFTLGCRDGSIGPRESFTSTIDTG